MIPKQYRFLLDEPAPRMLIEALKLHGTDEKPGPKSNPEILGWAEECGLRNVYTNDGIAWCGLFMAVVAKRAGKPLPKSPLWARDWLNWGEKADRPMLGDVMVWARGSGGHVAMYVGEDKTHYHILGGNQSDTVNIVRKSKTGFLGARRFYAIGQPTNVRVVKLSASGALAGSEA